ncbi:hypothetical protein [Actinoplanes sp. NPDC049118]|uniref:hypothetical protein n=1 Tax=Actinoplanes sp. NPDC049118 TaxID=3155769 RepID=UPI0033F5E102
MTGVRSNSEDTGVASASPEAMTDPSGGGKPGNTSWKRSGPHTTDGLERCASKISWPTPGLPLTSRADPTPARQRDSPGLPAGRRRTPICPPGGDAMYQDLPFADRHQRREARTGRHPRRRYVLAGEKDVFDPASPADYREYRTVVNYGHR